MTLLPAKSISELYISVPERQRNVVTVWSSATVVQDQTILLFRLERHLEIELGIGFVDLIEGHVTFWRLWEEWNGTRHHEDCGNINSLSVMAGRTNISSGIGSLYISESQRVCRYILIRLEGTVLARPQE